MGDYLRLLTVNDRDVPLAALQRAVPFGAVWSVDHPGHARQLPRDGARIRRPAQRLGDHRAQPRRPEHPRAAEEVAEFIDSLEAGGPPSSVRWLADYLETVRAIYAIRIYPDAMHGHAEAVEAVYSVRTALREAVGGVGQWDGQGFTNEDDRLIWCRHQSQQAGTTRAAMLDESTGTWVPFKLDFDNPRALAAFLRGELAEIDRSGHID